MWPDAARLLEGGNPLQTYFLGLGELHLRYEIFYCLFFWGLWICAFPTHVGRHTMGCQWMRVGVLIVLQRAGAIHWRGC